MQKRVLYTSILLLISFIPVFSQDKDRFIQVSGIVVDENFTPVGGVGVISYKLRRGAVSGYSGIYSLTSIPGDTIIFRAVGYKRYHSIIPEDFSDRSCTIDIQLELDTVMIEEVTILPWRTYNEFITEITKETEVDPIEEFMNENIKSIYVSIAKANNLNISAESAYQTVMRQNYDNMRYRNQYPVNNLLNPLAWAKFIRSAKSGELFKNETRSTPQPAKVIEPIKTRQQKREERKNKGN